MKKILAFGASNNSQSINKKLAEYVANQLTEVETTILDLQNFELPVYSVDAEKESGVPKPAVQFSQFIKESDAIIISLAEYNGLYTAAFKNLWDWMSRLGSPQVWQKKPMFLLGTSPSRREDSYVMKVSKDLFPMFGATIVASFHLPSFHHFFKENQITESQQQELFAIELQKFQHYLNQH
jgi:NAD(P)H-dependent FMN reductase